MNPNDLQKAGGLWDETVKRSPVIACICATMLLVTWLQNESMKAVQQQNAIMQDHNRIISKELLEIAKESSSTAAGIKTTMEGVRQSMDGVRQSLDAMRYGPYEATRVSERPRKSNE